MNGEYGEPKKAEKHETAPEQRTLPFDQVSMEKQLEILKAYAVYHAKEAKPAGYKEIAPLVKISPPMVSGCLKFWASTGLLVQSGRKYVPSQDLTEFCNNLTWGAEAEAWRRFRVALRDAWFVKHLEMRFSINPRATEEDILASVGSAVGVPRSPSTETSLRRMLELLEKAQFVKKENGQYSLAVPVEAPKRTIEVTEDSDLVTFVIGLDKYAVPLEDLKTFVFEKGRKLPSEEHRLGS